MKVEEPEDPSLVEQSEHDPPAVCSAETADTISTIEDGVASLSSISICKTDSLIGNGNWVFQGILFYVYLGLSVKKFGISYNRQKCSSAQKKLAVIKTGRNLSHSPKITIENNPFGR